VVALRFFDGRSTPNTRSHGPPYPNEYFYCKISEFENIRFVNRLPSQYFEVGRVDVNFRSPVPWDNEVNEILKPYYDAELKQNDRWENRVKVKLNDMHYKLDALKFHIELFKGFELDLENEFRKHIVANTTMNKIPDDPRLISIIESFLFQSKSNLDVFSQLITNSFREENLNGKDGNKLIKRLGRKLKIENNEETKKVIDIVQNNLTSPY
jgi:hypothetical protein